MFCSYLIDARGARYAGPLIADEGDARTAFAAQPVAGRFVRAELWAGTMDGNDFLPIEMLDVVDRDLETAAVA